MLKPATDEQINEFWDDLDDINAGMLGLEGRFVPMSHYLDKDEGVLWFITARGTQMAAETAMTREDAQYIVSSSSEHLYATLSGTLESVMDKDKLDELWNFVAASWFEGDKNDPDVQLLRFDIREAEVWLTKGAAAFFYEVAKANITDKKPDIGDHFKIAV